MNVLNRLRRRRPDPTLPPPGPAAPPPGVSYESARSDPDAASQQWGLRLAIHRGAGLMHDTRAHNTGLQGAHRTYYKGDVPKEHRRLIIIRRRVMQQQVPADQDTLSSPRWGRAD